MKFKAAKFNLKGMIATLVFILGSLTLLAGSSPYGYQQQSVKGSGGSIFTDFGKLRPRVPFIDGEATVTTNKSDYAPGEIVQITGTGFLAGESVRLEVDHVGPAGMSTELVTHQGHDPWFVTADSGGNIAAEWLVDEDAVNQLLRLTADGVTSTLHAETTFTDSAGDDFKQCANETPDGDGRCSWIGSILQNNNSRYFEGMSTMQRLIFVDVTATTGNTHVLGFGHEATKGGIHAYDFLTSWEQAIQAGADNGFPYVDLEAYTPVAGEPGTIDQTLTDARACGASIPNNTEPICLALRGASGFRFDVPMPDDAFISQHGSTQTRINGYETAYGQRYLRIYSNAAVTAASFDPVVHNVADGGDTGDSEISYELNFTTTATQVMFEFGAHISVGGSEPNASSTGFNWGVGLGSSSISGGPYHVNLDFIDGDTTGSQDNQLQGSDILVPQGSITIIKDAVPNDAQDFAYTTTGGLTPSTFSLDDDGDGTLSNTQTFGNLPNGTYTVTETLPVAGWSLADITCVDANGGSSDAGATATINLSAGEDVTCTFTNVKPDAQILLSPLTATNEVNDSHTITATVNQNDQLPAGAPGDGATGFGPAPDGTLVTFSLLNNTAGASFVGGNTCNTTGGTCSIQINTTTAGGVDVHATTTFSVLGVSLTRASGDGLSGDTADAHKTYVDAQIDLSPLNATNEVNSAHTITATVQQDDGIPAGAPGDAVTGFGPAPNGTLVTFSLLNNTAGATFVSGVSTCTTTAGSCSVQINTSTAGGVDIHATTTFSVGGVSLTRATGTGGLNSADAHKTYVDAFITLSPLTDTNPINEPHTITASVQQNDGIPAGAPGDAVTGFGPAPNGTIVTFNLLNNTAGATFVGANTCFTSGGTCSVQINSSTPGGVDIHATTTFSVGGVVLTRATGTGGNNSANAHKDYVAGVIIVDKVTDPAGDPQLFDFNASWDAGAAPDFQLADATAPNNSGNLAPGIYSVSETVPSGWDLTSATCSDGSPVSAIDLAAGETVTCTFNNQKDAVIITDKLTNPAGDAQLFDFNASWDAGAAPDFQLADATAPNNSGDLDPGAYTVAETIPAGWDLESISCVSSLGDPVDTDGVDLDLDAGETIVCRFTNEKDAVIITDKVTNPAGDAQLFDFNASWDAGAAPDFQLADATAPNNSGDLDPGAYTVAETVPTGWDLESISCVSSLGDPVDTDGVDLDLDAGETITCTFTNEKDAVIITRKETNPDGDTTVFDFNASWDPGDAPDFQLSDGQQNNSGDLDPGTYSVSETVPTGWDLTSSACFSSIGDTETAAALELDAGETITCTFRNEKDAVIITDKVTDPAGDAQLFDFNASWDAGDAPDFQLADATTPNNSGDLDPGTYSVAETVPAGWDLTSVVCNSSLGGTEDNTAIGLTAGETVTCTFTNTKRGTVTVLKRLNGVVAEGFDFQIRTGASPTEVGTTVASDTSDVDGNVDFGGIQLIPGTYQFCEVNMQPGFTSSLSSVPGAFVPNSDDPFPDNSVICVEFTLDPGETQAFEVDNTSPLGDARTIGFWKNWSSCTRGGQAPVLDYVLASFPGAPVSTDLPLPPGPYIITTGVTLGTLHIDTCDEAVLVLSKSFVGGGKKRPQASNPAVNMAAQLLAAILNIQAQADPLCIQDVIDEAKQLLIDVNYTGSSTGGISNGERIRLLELAELLDDYNNNVLVCPIP